MWESSGWAMWVSLARAFGARGISVLGFDVDPVKVAKLEQGQSYIGHIPDQRFARCTSIDSEATTSFDRLD